MKDRGSNESKEKSNFSFFQLLFFELWSFLWRHLPNFQWNFAIARKIHIGMFLHYFPTLFSTFHIFHIVFKVLTISEGMGEGLHILNCDRAYGFYDLSKRFFQFVSRTRSNTKKWWRKKIIQESHLSQSLIWECQIHTLYFCHTLYANI